ncbi:hypothetical protein NV379_19675 [Paenibacillus sp. N1-5-1-14]|uniref:hypothetical protein n=1 Tax=Paenibacillus radicibacter TaxID=2972488 RepID=UPI0021598962|nr:hypothetical protein [Paenibacillus radicibacter]MCR8644877.1 hypothetical protein [Paenibacillus radicibacter]
MSKAQIKVYAINRTLGSGTYGTADFFKRESNGSLTPIGLSSVKAGVNYDMTRIRLDAGNMADSNYSAIERTKTTGHEFGHALGLGHFEEGLRPHQYAHWMRSGQKSLAYPTSEDAAHLAYKY